MHGEKGTQLPDGGAEFLIHQKSSYFIRNLLIYE